MHSPRKDDNFANNCRFQTKMATKRQNLWTAALNVLKYMSANYIDYLVVPSRGRYQDGREQSAVISS